ncbi:MAG: head GIN domain-containing protein [Bacteroides sp.]
MMNFKLFIAALVATLCCVTACAQQYENTTSSGGRIKKHIQASRTYVTKEYRTADFAKIQLSGSADVLFEQRQGKPLVEVYTSDNVLEALDITVEGGMLKIGFKKGYKVSYNKLKVKVQSPRMEGIYISGSGDVDLKPGLKSDHLVLSIAGSGDINVADLTTTELKVSIAGSGDVDGDRIHCSSLNASIAGSGDIDLEHLAAGTVKASIAGSGTIELKGTADAAHYSVAGSGDIKASELVAKRVEASTTGSGDIECHATDFLKARTTGSGSVGYKGNPELDIPRKNIHRL